MLPDIQRIISSHLYTKWLFHLGFRVEKIHYFHAIIPLRKKLELPLKNKILNPFLYTCYMIVARKEIIQLTLENEFIKGSKQASSLADSMSRNTI